MAIVKVTEKGQITLPIDLRRKLRISKDDYLLVEAEGDVLRFGSLREKTFSHLMILYGNSPDVPRVEKKTALLNMIDILLTASAKDSAGASYSITARFTRSRIALILIIAKR